MPLLLFMLIPIVEMWILIEVGGWIGALPTIGLVVLTATIGLSLLKQQGLSTLMRARRKMDEGAIPASELASGVMIAVGGALCRLLVLGRKLRDRHFQYGTACKYIFIQ